LRPMLRHEPLLGIASPRPARRANDAERRPGNVGQGHRAVARQGLTPPALHRRLPSPQDVGDLDRIQLAAPRRGHASRRQLARDGAGARFGEAGIAQLDAPRLGRMKRGLGALRDARSFSARAA
jgi:hypothetical protein